MTKNHITTGIVLGGLMLAGSLMQSPGSTAKAVYATPVAIANTIAAPGSVLDADTATRIPYQSTVNASCGASFCSFNFSPVPTGYRLMVTNVGGRMTMNFGETSPPNLLLSDGGGKVAMGVQATLGGDDNIVLAGFNTRVTAFYDGGFSPALFASGNFIPAAATGQKATVSGFLINCSVTGCPPIQQ